MTPLPWSPSALEQFVNCPRQFHEVRILKSVKDEPGEQQLWGIKMHEAFEKRQRDKEPLPEELAMHEPYMRRIESWSVRRFTEQKVALDRHGRPCSFFSSSVWWRGIIDFMNIDGSLARLVDYKSGKPHEKWRQLSQYALWMFAQHPGLNLVDARFYWTQTMSETRKVWDRKEISELWVALMPDLRQYVAAFKEDIWQPRQSGLCAGWCPVESCEFWRARKS
jgi:hypothetical protein